MSSETTGKEDEDCLFLERVLDTLYDFGDGPASNRKLRSQKKKKRKRCEEEGEGVPTVGDTCSGSDDRGADLSTGAVQKQQRPNIQLAGPTIQPEKQVEVVTFQDPTKKQSTKRTPAPDNMPAVQIAEKKQSEQLDGLHLEKARLEVHRFGITGYKKEEQRVFEQDRAVMLGARPPKKNYVNYKVLQEQIKEKKQKTEVQPDLKKKKKRKNTERDKKKASSGSGSAPLGQLGRFKNGVLVLSSKEIQKESDEENITRPEEE